METALPDGDSSPALRRKALSRTADTLLRWTQSVGNTRLALSPLQARWCARKALDQQSF